jgi:Sigma-70, region 4
MSVSQNVPLPARDQRLVDLRAVGRTQQQCAETLGISRRTVGRRLQRAEVRRALAAAVVEMHEDFVRRVTAAATEAVGRLVRRAVDESVPPAERTAIDLRLSALGTQVQPKRLEAEVAVAAAEPPQSSTALQDWLADVGHNLTAPSRRQPVSPNGGGQ